MKLHYRNFIALQLVFLILFSTIGFNIITSVCFNCEEAHNELVFAATDDDNCSCCTNQSKGHATCCDQSEETHKAQHQKSSKLFQLKFESPEAKTKAMAIHQPVTHLFLVAILFNTNQLISKPVFYLNQHLPLPKAGKSLLPFICVFRN